MRVLMQRSGRVRNEVRYWDSRGARAFTWASVSETSAELSTPGVRRACIHAVSRRQECIGQLRDRGGSCKPKATMLKGQRHLNKTPCLLGHITGLVEPIGLPAITFSRERCKLLRWHQPHQVGKPIDRGCPLLNMVGESPIRATHDSR